MQTSTAGGATDDDDFLNGNGDVRKRDRWVYSLLDCQGLSVDFYLGLNLCFRFFVAFFVRFCCVFWGLF